MINTPIEAIPVNHVSIESLIGRHLDYYVGKALELDVKSVTKGDTLSQRNRNNIGYQDYWVEIENDYAEELRGYSSRSINWAPVLQESCVFLSPIISDGKTTAWKSEYLSANNEGEMTWYVNEAPQLQLAFLRSLVKSKFGNYVPSFG
jgi:hypothetical protein